MRSLLYAAQLHMSRHRQVLEEGLALDLVGERGLGAGPAPEAGRGRDDDRELGLVRRHGHARVQRQGLGLARVGDQEDEDLRALLHVGGHVQEHDLQRHFITFNNTFEISTLTVYLDNNKVI